MSSYGADFQFPAEPMRIVEIEVADGRVYPMFAEMMMHYSAYFRACLGNDWVEAQTLKVKLEEPEWAPVFPLLLEWVTRSRIASTPVDRTIEEVHDGNVVYQETELPTVRQCVDLWLLGDYLGMPDMQDNVIRMIFTKLADKCHLNHDWHWRPGWEFNVSPEDIRPPFHLVQRIWSATTPESFLRSLFIDFLSHPRVINLTCEARKVYGFPDEATEEFLERTARHQLELLGVSEEISQQNQLKTGYPEWGKQYRYDRDLSYHDCLDCDRLGTLVRKTLQPMDYLFSGILSVHKSRGSLEKTADGNGALDHAQETASPLDSGQEYDFDPQSDQDDQSDASDNDPYNH